MKDTHNVILIIVSSKWSSFFFPELFIMSFSWFEMLHLFFSGVPSFSRLYHHDAPSKSLHGFILFLSTFNCFPLSFSIRSSSWCFVKDSFHSSIVLQDFSRSYDPSSLLQNKHGVQHMFCFEEFKHSSSCIPKCNSFSLIFWGGVMSFLIIFFMFHDSLVVKNEIFKPIIFSSSMSCFNP